MKGPKTTLMKLKFGDKTTDPFLGIVNHGEIVSKNIVGLALLLPPPSTLLRFPLHFDHFKSQSNIKMGVLNLNQIVAIYSPSSTQEKLFVHQNGRIIAIDAPLALYR